MLNLLKNTIKVIIMLKLYTCQSHQILELLAPEGNQGCAEKLACSYCLQNQAYLGESFLADHA